MSLLMHSSTAPHMHSSNGPQMHGSEPGVGGGRPLEAYGFSGFPGNSLLAAGLYEARAASLLNARPAVGALGNGAPPWGNPPSSTGLPAMDDPGASHRLGSRPRAAVAVFELMSSVSFATNAANEKAVLSVAGRDLASIRRPSRSYFEQQLDLVEAESSLRDRRYTEILSQVAPPMAYYASIVNMQAERHGKSLLLLNTALDFAYAVTARFKHALACPRPSEYSAVIQPMIEVPLHPSFPAGHAVEGHVLAGLLAQLVPSMGGDKARYLRRAAARIAHNRVIAGLHFPIDLVAGRLLGDALASYWLACAGAATQWQGGSFDLDGASGNLDFSAGKLNEDGPAFQDVGCRPALAVTAVPMPFLQQMWKDAQAEWR